MPTTSSLSLAEWTVLAVLDQAPAHGFAIAALTSQDGPLGQVWEIPKPVVYRAIGRLEEAGLVRTTAVEPGRGPRRQVHAATPTGHSALRRWLAAPVLHVRDVRSQLLMKLALLDRRGEDATSLLDRQRALLDEIAQGLERAGVGGPGFESVLAAWRRSSAAAALAFVDELLAAARSGAEARPR